MPPPSTEAMISKSKGLNLSSPTMPATREAVRDDDDMGPFPAPDVAVMDGGDEEEETIAVSEMTEPAMAEPVMIDSEMAPSNEMPSTEERLAQLEASVAALRADYDQIVPTFKTLSVNTERLVGLLDQVEGQGGIKAKASAPAQSVPAMMSGSGEAAVTKVRFGAHPDKIRMVLDVSSLTGYSASVDNENHVLVVSLPEAGWSTVQQGDVHSPFISGWQYRPAADGGAMLVLQLKDDVKISGQNALPANGSKGPRIYVDIVGS